MKINTWNLKKNPKSSRFEACCFCVMSFDLDFCLFAWFCWVQSFIYNNKSLSWFLLYCDFGTPKSIFQAVLYKAVLSCFTSIFTAYSSDKIVLWTHFWSPWTSFPQTLSPLCYLMVAFLNRSSEVLCRLIQ